VSRSQRTHPYDALGLGVLLRLSGFLGLPATVGTLVLRPVVRVRFIVVVAALPTKEVEDFLGVGTAHAPSFRTWRVVVKRTTLSLEEITPSGGTYA
jgi:hypothetical protein